MKDILLIVLLLVIVGCAAYFIYRAKKRGEHCIGCPHSKECSMRAKQNCSGR